MAVNDDVRLVEIKGNTTNNLIKVWAVQSTTKNITRVMVIHKDINSKEKAQVSLHLSFATKKTGSLYTLSAPSPYSKFGVDLSGITWDKSENGKPVGTLKPTTVTPTSSTYSFTINPSTVSLLVIQ